MKKCPHCAEEIQDEAIKCKHCGEVLGEKKVEENKVEGKKSILLSGKFWAWTLGIFFIGFPTLVIMGSRGDLSHTPSPKPVDNRPASQINAEENEGVLRVYCQQGVEKRLKSPSTAKIHPGIPIYNAGDSKNLPFVTVKGTVDSQNGFGAMLRSSFECEMVWMEDKKDYQMMNIDIK